MKKLPYQSSLQFIQRPQLLWNDIGDRKLWRGIQWIRRGPTVPSRLSWNANQSNIPKPRSGVRWKHGMRRFSEYGNVASRKLRYQNHKHHDCFCLEWMINFVPWDSMVNELRGESIGNMCWKVPQANRKWSCHAITHFQIHPHAHVHNIINNSDNN